MINCIGLTFGYAESRQPCVVFFSSQVEYENVEQAAKSLLASLYVAYRNAFYEDGVRYNCDKCEPCSLSGVKFCSDCGEKSLISKIGKEYCPNWEDHKSRGEKYSLQVKNVKKFLEGIEYEDNTVEIK